MFPRWKYSLFQSWFRRTLAFQKPLAFLSEIINCFTNIFDRKQLKYSPKVHIFALRRENGNSRRNEPLFLVSVNKLHHRLLSVTQFPFSKWHFCSFLAERSGWLFQRSHQWKNINGPLRKIKLWSSSYLLPKQIIIITINQFYLKWKHASLAQLKADLQEGRDIQNSKIYRILYEPNLPSSPNNKEK
jgi:hypothetical protein